MACFSLLTIKNMVQKGLYLNRYLTVTEEVLIRCLSDVEVTTISLIVYACIFTHFGGWGKLKILLILRTKSLLN